MRDTFTMEFEPATIEHLGQKLYSTLPPVIGELVSNSWDADSERVEITLPIGQITPQSEIVVKDWGHGMNDDDVQDRYLRIGLNRREIEESDISPGERPLMGRKGLGKLSAFGIATLLEIRTVKNGEAVCLMLDFDRMRTWPKGKKYKPQILWNKCGKTNEKSGTEIRIRNLSRKSPITEGYVETIRKNLARRFSIIGKDFEVIVNGKKLTHKDRRLKEDCRKAWNVSELPGKGIIDEIQGWQVEGWMGLAIGSSRKDTGIDIFARGKAAELGTLFEKTTDIQFAQAYILGELHAEFLDAEIDNIATARNSVHWETDAGQKLWKWGTQALKFVAKKWLELQRKEKEEKIMKSADFESWIKLRNKREQRIARKFVDLIVDDKNIEPESAGPLLEIIKTNIERRAFQDLVNDIEETGGNAETFLKLVEEWRIIDARENLILSDGRKNIIGQLDDFITKGALEVQEIQPLFEEYGWLIEPTWGSVTGQTTYTQLLRQEFEEPPDLEEKNRRMDILGYDVGGTIHVVELKRPEKTLSRNDLEQIERYVDWARGNMSKYVRGLLIVGKLNDKRSIHEKMRRLEGDSIRVLTFPDLLQRAQVVYGEVQQKLEKVAPEYSTEARKKNRELAKAAK